MLGEGSVANSLVMWISVVLKLVKGFSIRTGTGRDGLLKARSCLRLAKISRPARTSGLQVRSQYCLSEGVCRAPKHVPRAETFKTCLDAQNLDQRRMYRLREHVHIQNEIKIQHLE